MGSSASSGSPGAPLAKGAIVVISRVSRPYEATPALGGGGEGDSDRASVPVEMLYTHLYTLYSKRACGDARTASVRVEQLVLHLVQ